MRRDLKLLLGANLAEVINAVFPVITCRKPANTILVPNRFVRFRILELLNSPAKQSLSFIMCMSIAKYKLCVWYTVAEVMSLHKSFMLGTWCGLVMIFVVLILILGDNKGKCIH